MTDGTPEPGSKLGYSPPRDAFSFTGMAQLHTGGGGEMDMTRDDSGDAAQLRARSAIDDEKCCFFTGRLARVMLAGTGFLADAYDLFVINLVMDTMKEAGHVPDDGQKAAVKSAALWGAVLGQLVFGSLADMIGRRIVFVATVVLISIGALGSAMCSGAGVFTQLAICRFILGLGVGGEYPLSATVTSESASPREKGRALALVFSCQGMGVLLAAVVFNILLNTNASASFSPSRFCRTLFSD